MLDVKLAKLLLDSKLSKDAINALLEIVNNPAFLGTSYKNIDEMASTISDLTGNTRFRIADVVIDGNYAWSGAYKLRFRVIKQIVINLLTTFGSVVDTSSEITITNEDNPVQTYREFKTGTWSNEKMVGHDPFDIIVLIIISSDVTQLHKKEHPLYMTIGNISIKLRKQASKAVVMIALFPSLNDSNSTLPCRIDKHRLFHTSLSLILQDLKELG